MASTTPPPTETGSGPGGGASPPPTSRSPPASPAPDVLDVDRHGVAGSGFAAFGRLPRQHLDFRAQGGYVLAPPSQVEGRPYRLIAHHAQSGGLDWAAVTTLLEPERTRPAQPGTAAPGDLSHLAVWVERLQEGNRNAYFCCSERAEGVGFEPTRTRQRPSGFQDRRHRPLGEPSSPRTRPRSRPPEPP